MASIDKRPNGKFRARWREHPGGPQLTKSFDRKMDAERHLVAVQHAILSGTYLTPESARLTVEDYYRSTWLPRMKPAWRSGTQATVEVSFDRHVLPILGKRPLTAVRRADIESFAAGLKLAPSTVAVVVQHAGQMFNGAIDDGLLKTRNPTYRARLPKNEGRKVQPVPLEVVARVEAALPDWLKVAVSLGVGAGLRQGELSGLSVDRIEFLRRTVRVDRQLISRNVPQPVLGPVKTASSNRTVPLAAVVLTALSEHLRAFPAENDQLLLRTPAGEPVDADKFGNPWRTAVKKAGAPGLRYHDLRHTFASTLLSRGVSVKAVADWLGHASPVITLNTYAHLMPADEDVARSVLDEALSQPAEDSLRTGTDPS
ncbi:MAG: traSA:integrase fusion protein [Actinomycetia bacterium]|nr:traSA:integrase fusion protein [Actinomycetes bacterium]